MVFFLDYSVLSPALMEYAFTDRQNKKAWTGCITALLSYFKYNSLALLENQFACSSYEKLNVVAAFIFTFPFSNFSLFNLWVIGGG